MSLNDIVLLVVFNGLAAAIADVEIRARIATAVHRIQHQVVRKWSLYWPLHRDLVVELDWVDFRHTKLKLKSQRIHIFNVSNPERTSPFIIISCVTPFT